MIQQWKKFKDAKLIVSWSFEQIHQFSKVLHNILTVQI
jgi:hypothetical protein